MWWNRGISKTLKYLDLFYYCFYRFALLRDTMPACNKVSGIFVVLIMCLCVVLLFFLIVKCYIYSRKPLTRKHSQSADGVFPKIWDFLYKI